MSWCWLLRAPHPPAGALAWAALRTPGGTRVGGLAALPGDAKEADAPEGAVKVDARAVDPYGPAGALSLVLAPPGAYLPFDDVAVTGAIRRAISGPAVDVVSTLTLSDDRFLGALTGVHGADLARAYRLLGDDPFAVLFPRKLLSVEAGLLGRTPPPVGPSMQRYGAGNPWPWDRFPTEQP